MSGQQQCQGRKQDGSQCTNNTDLLNANGRILCAEHVNQGHYYEMSQGVHQHGGFHGSVPAVQGSAHYQCNGVGANGQRCAVNKDLVEVNGVYWCASHSAIAGQMGHVQYSGSAVAVATGNTAQVNLGSFHGEGSLQGGIPPNASIVDQGHTHGFEDVVVRVPRRTQTRTIQGPAQIKIVEVPGEVREQVVKVTVPGPIREEKVVVPGPPREIIQKVDVPGRVVEKIEKVHIPGKTRERVEKVMIPGPIRERVEKVPVPGPTREIIKTVEVPGKVVEQVEKVIKPGKVNVVERKVDVPGPVIEKTIKVDVPGPTVVRRVEVPVHIDGGVVDKVIKVDVPREVVREIFQERPVPIVNPVPTVVPGPKHTVYQMVPDEKAIRTHTRLLAKLERARWEQSQPRGRKVIRKKRVQVPVDAPEPAPVVAAAARPQQQQWVAAAPQQQQQQQPFYQSTGFLNANYGGFAAPAAVRYGSLGGYNMVQQQQVVAAAPAPVAAAAAPRQQGYKWIEVDEEVFVGGPAEGQGAQFVSTFNEEEFTRAYLAQEQFQQPQACRLCEQGIPHTGATGSFHGDFAQGGFVEGGPVQGQFVQNLPQGGSVVQGQAPLAPGLKTCPNCQYNNDLNELAANNGLCKQCGMQQ